MSTELPITCPTGLQVIVREMTGHEITALMSAKADADDGAILLQQCITQAVDPGALYTTWGEGVFIVDDMALGDVVVTMLGIRRATFGDEFDLTMVCPACRHENSYTINLVTDVPIKPMDPEAVKRMLAGDPFATAAWGHTIYWLPATRRERQRVSKLSKLEPAKRYALGASLRIHRVKDNTTGKEVHANDLLTWIEAQGAGKIGELMALMDYFDGGVETTQEFRCGGPSCHVTVRGELPLDRALFQPPKKKWQKAGTRPDPTSIG